MDNIDAVSTLAALAQASRLAVFRQLVELGPDGSTPGELVQALGIPPNTLSFHLKALAQAGLVVAEPSGRFIRYRAGFDRMQALVDFLTRNCCGGDPTRCAPVVAACVPTSAKPTRKPTARAGTKRAGSAVPRAGTKAVASPPRRASPTRARTRRG